MREDHFEWIIQNLGDAGQKVSVKGEMMSLTPKVVAELDGLFQMAGLGASAFIKSLECVPEGLNENTLRSWLNGRVRKIKKSNYEFIKNTLMDNSSLRSNVSDYSRYKTVLAENRRGDTGLSE